MISIPLTIPARKPAKRRGLSFEGSITLGNLLAILPLLGLLVTALMTYWTAAREVQRFQDAIAHETEMRTLLLKGLTEQMAAIQAQEARDVTLLNQSLVELRQDIRAASRGRAPD